MRSTASSSEIRTILRDNYKKYWTVPAIGLFMLLCWGFIPAILSGPLDKESIIGMATNANVGYVTAMLILAVGSGMTVFSYLQNPGASNYVHSLPLDRGRLFTANVLSGLLMIAGPLVINGVLMCALTGSPLFIKWILPAFIGCFAIFAITVFAAMVSGNTLMHLFNTAFFNGIVTVIALVFYDLSYSLLIGYAPPQGWIEFMFRSNPVTALVGEGSTNYMIWAIYLIVGIAALIISRIIYNKRPIERTGESVVFRWVRVLLFVICVFAGASFIGILFAEIINSEGVTRFGYVMLIGMALGALFVFVVGSLMIDRSAKIFTKRNLIPAAIAFVLAIGISSVYGTGAFGYNDNIPGAGDVKTVYVDTSAELFNIAANDDYMYTLPSVPIYYKDNKPAMDTPSGTRVLGMEDQNSIQAAIDLHKMLLAQDWDHGYSLCRVGIVYELKNGKTIRRDYPVLFDDPDVITSTKELSDATTAYINTGEFKEKYSVMNVRSEYMEEGVVTVYPTGYSGEDDFFKVPAKDLPSLKEAMDKDLKENTVGRGKVKVLVTGTAKKALKGDEFESYTEIEIPLPEGSKHTETWIKNHRN